MFRKIFIFTFLYMLCGMATVFYLGGQKSNQYYHAQKYSIFEYQRPYAANISKKFNIVPAAYLGVTDGFYTYASDVIFRTPSGAKRRTTLKYPKAALDKGNLRNSGVVLDVTLADKNQSLPNNQQIIVVMSGYLFTHDAQGNDQRDIQKVIKAIDAKLKTAKISQKIIPIITESPYDLHAYIPARHKIIQGPQLMPLAPDHGLMRSDALSHIDQYTRQHAMHDIWTWPLSAGPELLYKALCLVDGCP